MDKEKLVDQKYYAIASKATLVKPDQLPISKNKRHKFKRGFNASWNEMMSAGKIYNAADACKFLGVDANGLNAAWVKAKKDRKHIKLGNGFYCALIDSIPGKPPIYVLNGFFMAMRAKFVNRGASIHYYVVEFSSDELKWADFRGKVLGQTV